MDIFLPFGNLPAGRPFVVGQLGQSLDGRIATLSGDARNIGGAAGITHLHNLRAHVDAVVVGAATVLADDPQLTVRLAEGRNPARVVIDPRGRIGNDGRWLAGDGAQRILVTSAESAPRGCDEVIKLQPRGAGFEPLEIAEALYARGFGKILIEGGAITLSHFIEKQCLDRLHVVVSPVIIGSGKASIDLPPIASLTEAIRPDTRVFHLGGGEVLFDCSLRAVSSSWK